jgi:hypothetical protein
MYKSLFVVCVLVASVGIQAQGIEVASSSAPPITRPSISSQKESQSTQASFLRKGVFAPSTHSEPVATFTTSYVYQYAPNYLGADRSLMGWSVVPEVNFTKYLGLQAEFTSLYMRGVGLDQSRFMIAAGPRVTLAPHSKLTPFAFGEGGEIRATQEGSDASNWNPVATAGIGVDYKISHGISFQLIPGEYVGQRHDNTGWSQSFMTKAGITFNLYK